MPGLLSMTHNTHRCSGSDKVHVLKTLFGRLALACVVLLAQACATSAELASARSQFKQGNTQAALQGLNEADVSRRDELLLLFDKALVAQGAGHYAQSIEHFERAYTLVEKLSYLSVRDQSSAILTSDWAIRYSGEYSERLWIHTFQMINYLMLDNPGGAAVEARRAVRLYEKNGDVLDNDFFTRYLMALSFAAAGQNDSASVEFRKLTQLTGTRQPHRDNSSGKELVLMIATGFIEPKLAGDLLVSRDARIAFPYYPELYERAPGIVVNAGTQSLALTRIDTSLVSISRNALAKRGKSIAARQALRVAAKYSLAQDLERQDPLAGGIIKLFFLAVEQADTRSWETLPAYLSLVRVSVPDTASSVSVRINSIGTRLSRGQSAVVQVPVSDENRQFHAIRAGVEQTPRLMVSR